MQEQLLRLQTELETLRTILNVCSWCKEGLLKSSRGTSKCCRKCGYTIDIDRDKMQNGQSPVVWKEIYVPNISRQSQSEPIGSEPPKHIFETVDLEQEFSRLLKRKPISRFISKDGSVLISPAELFCYCTQCAKYMLESDCDAHNSDSSHKQQASKNSVLFWCYQYIGGKGNMTREELDRAVWCATCKCFVRQPTHFKIWNH